MCYQCSMSNLYQHMVAHMKIGVEMCSTLTLFLILRTSSAIGQETASLNGMSLKMAAENWDPLFVISEQKSYSGVMAKVLDYLQSNLNFSTTVLRPPDGSWGVVDEKTGEWGGMVGMVLRSEADFGLGKIEQDDK